MQSQILIALAIARDFQDREIQRVAEDRRHAVARSSIRRAVGRRVIAFGQRIAAEPSLELARSR
jgi:hypothetical protein